MSIFPGFGGAPSPPPPPPPPPPPVQRTDPGIAEAKRKLEASEAKRRGRRSSMLTQSGQVTGGSILRPSADDDNSKLG
tara:strand:- start:4179 stop:4412 length:234 start_codon:yes stop_codon:yes gene_type:complete